MQHDPYRFTLCFAAPSPSDIGRRRSYFIFEGVMHPSSVKSKSHHSKVVHYYRLYIHNSTCVCDVDGT